jgi:hypothetical protein
MAGTKDIHTPVIMVLKGQQFSFKKSRYLVHGTSCDDQKCLFIPYHLISVVSFRQLRMGGLLPLIFPARTVLAMEHIL